MRAEMTELRRDVNDVKSKGADKVQWPTINSKVTANDDTPESNATSGETTGSMIGATSGAKSGASVGSTIGATIGATSGASVGSTIGATSGATSDASVGSTIGSTSGASVGSTIGSRSGASVGSTIGATSGPTSGASVGSTIGATSGARTSRTTYPNGGKTRRTPRADDDGYVTVTRRTSSKVGFNNQMKRPVIGTRSHGNTLKVNNWSLSITHMHRSKLMSHVTISPHFLMQTNGPRGYT